jgi:4-deoxy-L-threo-5-hexosulose-uronate ketol-isomerase
MKIKYESRFAVSPNEVKTMNTEQLRKNFLIENIFQEDTVHLVQTFFDRFIAGGIMPVNEAISLPNIPELKAAYFLERREMGIINVGGKGKIIADEKTFSLNYKDALYLAQGTENISFVSEDKNAPALFYINSAPAHHAFDSKLITKQDAVVVTLGSQETANNRTINKFIITNVLSVCQLQMGLTELHTGNVWNTMPAHTHDRRMEVYFYFEIPEGNSVCHFMGEPQETRHIWMQNNQAVIVPNWSIHAGAGTSNYSFIWGMAGENLDYDDMDKIGITALR